jgi:hypothetical protein
MFASSDFLCKGLPGEVKKTTLYLLLLNFNAYSRYSFSPPPQFTVELKKQIFFIDPVCQK